MCGLFGGYSNYLSQYERESIEVLGVLAQLRGVDSAGIVTCCRKHGAKVETIKVRKCLGTTSHLFHSKEYEEATNGVQSTFIIGHARQATVGAVTSANAHPFQIGSLYGVHNGTIHKYVVPEKERDHNSDSRILFENINADGVDKTIADLRGDGAYAVVFFDRIANTLNFFRNDKRTLFYMFGSGKSTIYWSSERIMLDFMKQRSNNTSSFSEIYPFLEDRLYTIRHGYSPSTMTSRKIGVVEAEIITPPVKDVTRHHVPFIRSDAEIPFIPDNPNVSTRGVNLSPDKSGLTLVMTKNDKRDIKNGVLIYRGYNNQPLTLSEVTNKLSRGCVFTQHKASIFEKVYWFNNDEYMMKSIADRDPDIKNLFFAPTCSLYESSLERKNGDTVTCH